MIGLQEMARRLEKPENKEAAEQVKQMLDNGYYDYDETNIYGTGMENQTQIKTADFQAIKESVKDIPLREFLARSGTTGIAGAIYLIPTKIHQIMFDSAVQADIVADISIAVIPADQIPGTTHQVDIAVDDSYVPKKFMSGGQIPTETIKTEPATLDFSEAFGINFRITNDLIEDSQFDVIEMHLRNAGREMGEFATNEAVTVLMASTDGDGTLNTESAGGDVTTFTDVMNAVDKNLQDGYVSDIYLCSHHIWFSEIIKDTTYTQDADAWRNEVVHEGFSPRLLGMNVIMSECNMLSMPLGVWTATLGYTDLNSYVMTKDYSLLSGRKRWLRIEQYSDPVRDLVGATVTSRQDSVTIYNDSICRIRES